MGYSPVDSILSHNSLRICFFPSTLPTMTAEQHTGLGPQKGKVLVVFCDGTSKNGGVTPDGMSVKSSEGNK